MIKEVKESRSITYKLIYISDWDSNEIDFSVKMFHYVNYQVKYSWKGIPLTTHQWIQSTPYVCNERIFEGLIRENGTKAECDYWSILTQKA